ncbi:hypothetical protein [Nitratifractor salsuginis]|uniref:hypothetical protein n=1 Tax=Nitratifractor salsuginis TaxID=269261 RepID=UPI000320038B|nr:hypothetical protein [Nitratifractor salsuginis]
MRKYQPEGGYIPLDHPDYTRALEATAVTRITLHEIRHRIKFGQRLPQERFTRIVHALEKRNAPGDSELTELMKHYRAKETK